MTTIQTMKPAKRPPEDRPLRIGDSIDEMVDEE
jgi:hypothetical protein